MQMVYYLEAVVERHRKIGVKRNITYLKSSISREPARTKDMMTTPRSHFTLTDFLLLQMRTPRDLIKPDQGLRLLDWNPELGVNVECSRAAYILPRPVNRSARC